MKKKKRHYTGNGIKDIPVQKVNMPHKSMSEEEQKRCSCYRKGYCTMRDDKCLPYSLKCIKNKQAFSSATFVSPVIEKNEAIKRVYRGARNYNPYVSERYGSNQEIEVLEGSVNIERLYVFKGMLNLSKQYTTDYYLHIEGIETRIKHKILVAYNKKTNKFYISDTQLKWLHKQKIYPAITFRACNDGTIPLDTIDFNQFSILSLYGYSAGKSGLKTHDRRKILRYIMDNNILRKYKIIEYLQSFISLREDREDADYSIAIRDWREDIKYVNDYRR